MVNVDLTKNKKQASFFYEVMKAAKGQSDNRFFSYGGAVRGGKTYIILTVLAMFAARMFPKSRWHIIRRDMPTLQDTTIPSMQKILPDNQPHYKYIKDRSNYHITFSNQSKIFFKGENLIRDRELKGFLGLETNGVFLEQAEELSERLFDMVIQRSGSWYVDPMPNPFIFLSFNPNDEWPRKKIYDPYKQGLLQSPYYFQEALPSDNPFVTPEQWDAWKMMDEIEYKRFIAGDWDSYRKGNEFYYGFSKTMHTKLVTFNPDLPVHITFDQNVVPYITMNCWQADYQDELIIKGNKAEKVNMLYLRQFDEIHLSDPRNSTEEVCLEFQERYGDQVRKVFLYGDATGRKRSTRTKQNDYDIVSRVLRQYVSSDSDRVVLSNPSIIQRRRFINNLFSEKYNVRIEIDSDRCRNTINDYHNLKQDVNGHKKKEIAVNPLTKEAYQKYGHASDANDYFLVSVLSNRWDRFLNNY